MAEVAHESVQITRLVLWPLGAFAATALVLAAVGVYGVMSYVVGQRAREIGTRIALGAAPRDILWMVLRQGAIIAATGTAAGVAIGLLAARSLRSILYGVSSADPLILIGAAATLVATALVACWLPARRAVAVDPARTLSDDCARPIKGEQHAKVLSPGPRSCGGTDRNSMVSAPGTDDRRR